MKKILLAAALTLVPALFSTSKASAQNVQYGTEVCVNASNVEDAKRLFPDARLHVLPDFPDSRMNGWRIVSGTFDAKGRIHTDAEELQLRQRERSRRWQGTSE
jgi:hypothetical protein